MAQICSIEFFHQGLSLEIFEFLQNMKKLVEKKSLIVKEALGGLPVGQWDPNESAFEVNKGFYWAYNTIIVILKTEL